ncbi:MAG: DUF1571 domain-containing protein [Aureliella sp.]
MNRTNILLVLSLLGLVVISFLIKRSYDQAEIEAASTFEPTPPSNSLVELDPEGDSLPRLSQEDLLFGLHPDASLSEVLDVAKQICAKIDAGVQDYTATLVSQERIGKSLKAESRMQVKIRSASDDRGLSVYLKFESPDSAKGREVIWIDGDNDGKLLVHEAGFKRMVGTLHLEPTGPVAMMGQKYPLTDIGLRNLAVKLIEKGEHELEIGQAVVGVYPNQQLGERSTLLIEVNNPIDNGKSDFHIARIYIDDELQLPVLYEAYMWPAEAGGQPRLEERYAYEDLTLNVGLTDADFDPKNVQYDFP